MTTTPAYAVSEEYMTTTFIKDIEDSGFVQLKGKVMDARILTFKGRDLQYSTDEQLEPDKEYKVNRGVDAIRDPRFLESVRKAPLLFLHKRDVTPKDAPKHMGGYPVSDTRFANESTLELDYMLCTEESIAAYHNKLATELSGSYVFKTDAAPPGAGYDRTMHSMIMHHIAQVPYGKNGKKLSLSEENMSEMELSDKSATSLAQKIVDGIKGLLPNKASEESEDANKKKPGDEAAAGTVTEEAQAEAVKAAEEKIKALYADKMLVQKLLPNDESRKFVEESDDSATILAFALGMEEKDVKGQDPAVLRGRVQERLKASEESASQNQESRSWAGIRGTSNAGTVTNMDWYKAQQAATEKVNKQFSA